MASKMKNPTMKQQLQAPNTCYNEMTRVLSVGSNGVEQAREIEQRPLQFCTSIDDIQPYSNSMPPKSRNPLLCTHPTSVVEQHTVAVEQWNPLLRPHPPPLLLNNTPQHLYYAHTPTSTTEQHTAATE